MAKKKQPQILGNFLCESVYRQGPLAGQIACGKVTEHRYSVSTTTGKIKPYCEPCHIRRTKKNYTQQKENGGVIPVKVKKSMVAEHMSEDRSCNGCGRKTHEIPMAGFKNRKTPWTIDHIIPTKHGGTAEPSNLRVLCYRCNSAEGGKVGYGAK